MKKIRKSIILTAVISITAVCVYSVTASAENRKVVENIKVSNTDFCNASCFDINKDGYTDSADLVLMRSYLVQSEDMQIPEYELHNSNLTNELISTAKEYLSERCPEWYARVNNISLDVESNSSGYFNWKSIIATISFDKPLDEYALHSLVTGICDIESETEYVLKNNISTLRMTFDNYDNVSSVMPVMNGEISSEIIVNEGTDFQKHIRFMILEYLSDRCPEWFARITEITLSDVSEYTDNCIATVSFDKPLDEYALHSLLKGEFDIESETEYVLKNNINTLRISATYGEIEAVVPYNK